MWPGHGEKDRAPTAPPHVSIAVWGIQQKGLKTMKLRHLTAGMLMAAGAAALSIPAAAPASAGVSIGLGIGIPGPGYYAVRGGRCANPRFAYYHPAFCGYPQYSEPVFIDGAWVDQPLYYREHAGERYFWWHGGWRVGHGKWDGRHFDRDRDGPRMHPDHRDHPDRY